MRIEGALGCLLLAALLPVSAVSSTDSSLAADRFVLASTGAYQVWTDRRELIVMSHPWVPSCTGSFAEARATIEIPQGAPAPQRLSFSVSDDYFNDFWRARNDSWLGGDGFLGHRYKQVWVNRTLAWESDVADPNPPSVSGTYVVPLPSLLKPEDGIEIAFRVADRVASNIRLASDTQHIGTTETAAEAPGDPPRFMTHVYWGNIHLLGEDEALPPLAPPIHRKVEEIHKTGWPIRSESDPDLTRPLSFRLETVAPIPASGFPVHCGVPLPEGRTTKVSDLALRGPEGELVPAGFTRMSTWPDGSVRWAVVRFTAQRGQEGRTFEVGISPEQTQMDTAIPAISLELTPDRKGFRTDQLVFRAVATLSDETEWSTALEGVRTEPDGFSGKAAAMGLLRREDGESLPCRVELSVVGFVACAIHQVELRVFFEDVFPSPLAELRVEAQLPKGSADGSGKTHSLLDDRGRHWIGDSTSEREFSGWLLSEGAPRRLAGVRHARATGQAGIEIRETSRETRVSWLAFTNVHSTRGYPFTPGEAKTFQMLLATLSDKAGQEEARHIAENFERPPLLVNATNLCRSGAFGLARPADEESNRELSRFLEERYPDPLGASLGWGKGPRDFGDLIYTATDSWRNGYYDLRQGFIAAYLLTGNRVWADALEQTVRHTIDVDWIHSCADHPEWVGLPHGYGTNHTSMEPWNPILRMNGILGAAHIWGNHEFHARALSMARRLVETSRALGAGSVRDHAGVLMSLVSAYRETREPIFREGAERLIRDIAVNRIDPLRGCYPEVHGNWNYRGNVPWMVAQLIEPLYLFYRATGDLAAAKIAAGLAESILCENQTRGVPGDIFGYSHNPHFKKNSSYHVLIAPCLFFSHDLTRDEEFRNAALAAWKQTVAEGTLNDVLNCFWNTPALAYYLGR
ncbi:MAG: hypothetical protein HUU16_09730 [Candidatus Omnitrophica bacterium]|nr:hypothetical protein [Candidatus Omnitrophota bacterium]